ncbi:MAG: hypothetical protein GYA24_07215 [Candidatus Lokiarchaeota archaeon]|nr:hypothetical protein [Candidatus Lokiarchaeota archaeon]
MVQAELILNLARSERNIEPGILPATFIGRHFQTGEDPYNAGVTMYVDYSNGRVATMTWADLEFGEFEIPDGTGKIDQVFSFWEAVPDNY